MRGNRARARSIARPKPGRSLLLKRTSRQLLQNPELTEQHQIVFPVPVLRDAKLSGLTVQRFDRGVLALDLCPRPREPSRK
jgi:hypothetical protein